MQTAAGGLRRGSAEPSPPAWTAASTTGKYNGRGELNGLWAARPFNSATPLCSFCRRVVTRVDGSLYYVHSDLLGSTVAVSDAAGQAVGRVQYDPYGEILTSTLPATLTDRLFTGQRLDSSTGLYYYNARYYDPYLGRFIQPDTLVPDPLNPQAWNRFSYCGNNPATYADPSGRVWWVPLAFIAGGATRCKLKVGTLRIKAATSGSSPLVSGRTKSQALMNSGRIPQPTRWKVTMNWARRC